MICRLLLASLALLFAGARHRVEAETTCTAPLSSFELIQRAIFDRHDCNMSYCHGADRQAGLDLRPGNSYASLLGSGGDAGGDAFAGFKLVEPGQPDQSLLWRALASKTLRNPRDASPMPKDGLPLTREEVEAVREWIMAGAPERGFVDRVDDLIQACPPSTYEDDDNIADLPQCNWGDPMLMLPNLVPDPPADVRVFSRNNQRRVEFTTRVANIGDGPLIIQARTLPPGPGRTVDAMQVILRRDGSKCVHRAGTMRLSDEGNRWQYGNFADFELRKDDPVTGPVVASSSKPAFCLVDSDSIRAYEGAPHQYALHCTDPIGRMGISVGYKDTYSRQHPAQWIDLDADPNVPVEAGISYYLINIADPSGRLWEKNDKRDDNMNYTIMGLGLPDPDAPQTRPTPGASEPTPPSERTRPPRMVRTPVQRPERPDRAPRPERPGRPTPTVGSSTGSQRPTPVRPTRPLSPQHPSRP